MESKILKNNFKVIYKGPMYKSIKPKDPNIIYNELTNSLKEVIKDDKSNSLIDYPKFYDYFYSIKDCSTIIDLIDKLLSFIKLEIQEIFNLNDINLKHNPIIVEDIISRFKKAKKLINTVKLILNNEKTKYEKEVILKINDYLTPKIIISDVLKASHFETHFKDYLFSNNLNSSEEEEQQKENKIFLLLQFLKENGFKNTFIEYMENLKVKILSNYDQLNLNTNDLNNFLKESDNKIKNSCFKFKRMFGEHEASKLKEQLIDKMFIQNTDKMFSHDTNNNNNILENEENLKILYNIVNKSAETLKIFAVKFFNFFYLQFSEKIKQADSNFNNNTIKEGVNKVKLLHESVLKLNYNIYNLCFNKDRRLQILLKETISRMCSNKIIKNISVYLAIYLHEIMLTNFDSNIIKQKIEELFDILNKTENVDLFISVTHKYMIRRLINNFSFIDLKNENEMLKLLTLLFGLRYCFQLYRILNDVKKSKELIVNEDNNKFQLFLFSYNSIKKENDLAVVIKVLYPELENNCNEIASFHKHLYPHRSVTFSQSLSVCQIIFNKSITVYLNYVQTSIVMLFRLKSQIKKQLKLQEIMEMLQVNNIIHFRSNFLPLLSTGLLSINNKTFVSNKDDFVNEDSLSVNFNFNKNNLNLSNLVNTVSNASSNNNSTNSVNNNNSNNEDNIQSNIEESYSNSKIYNVNKHYIIDSKIVKILKQWKELEYNLLVKIILNEINTYTIGTTSNNAEITLIQSRLAAVIERGFIAKQINNESGQIIYNYIE